MHCAECRQALQGSGRKLAKEIEQKFPACECEKFSIGEKSPGKIADDEILYRMFVDPVDVEDGRLARAAFSKVYQDGLSIIRDCANDLEIEALATDILSTKPGQRTKTVLAIFKFVCRKVRQETVKLGDEFVRAFCVYDQTVPRVFERGPPVPTHGTVLSRRLYELPITTRQFENDCNFTLHQIVATERVSVEEFRGGLIARLNERSVAGEFVRQTH
ncbi:hypothetical protein [Bradyrhizobium sp.]|jgi:hypothetical protein|uniref:hypothetical protein n=1 Tax=Bradyrhizobium sp. TaxID=376 RepID=UPI002E012DF7|nr:hypothetical protein [Bradyrhizobium sp.]